MQAPDQHDGCEAAALGRLERGVSKLLRGEFIADLVSSTVIIPLAMAFGRFAIIPLGDRRTL